MRPGKHSISSGFGADLIGGGGLWLPRILLQNYTKLGITNMEMVFLIHLLDMMSAGASDIRFGAIAEYMNVTPEKVFALLNSLEAKDVLRRNSQFHLSYDTLSLQSLSFEGLFDKLLEIWGCEKAKDYERQHAVPYAVPGMPENSRVISDLYHCFEKEFGRALSPMESTQIMEWYYGDKYTFELILEALKRSVLRGVLNFKYIDSILRGWSKNNLKTVKAIISYEEAFSENKKAENKKIKGKKVPDTEAADLDKKYNDIYLT